jgi:hypothetical protein
MRAFVCTHGCALQAALQLGLRASRRPAGYWDSLEVLDMELDAFIAGQHPTVSTPQSAWLGWHEYKHTEVAVLSCCAALVLHRCFEHALSMRHLFVAPLCVCPTPHLSSA